MAAGQGAQGVGNGKGAGDGQGNAVVLPPASGGKLHPVWKKLYVLRGEVGLVRPILRRGLFPTESDAGTGNFPPVVSPGLIVHIQHGSLTLVKEPPLGLTVSLHGLVKIQVVLGQVGKGPHSKGYPIHSVQTQGVGGYLHHHMGTVLIGHSPQPVLEIVTLRGRASGWELLLSHQHPVGANEAHLSLQRLSKQVPKKGGDSGLSVGPGDADDL